MDLLEPSQIKKRLLNYTKKLNIKDDEQLINYGINPIIRDIRDDDFYCPDYKLTICTDKTHGNYLYYYSEHGVQECRYVSKNIDDILFQIIDNSILYPIASTYELTHRKENQDFRRILFKKEVSLAGKINSAFKNRVKERQRFVLEKYPYHDSEVNKNARK